MVLETLFKVKDIELKPSFALVLAFVVSSASMFLSALTFPSSTSILTIAFITTAMMPLIHGLFEFEEKKEVMHPGKAFAFLRRHFALVKVYAWFFIGLIISFSFWYVILPSEVNSNNVFDFKLTKEMVFGEQLNNVRGIESVRSSLTGDVISSCSEKGYWNAFTCIFSNNLFVLGLAFLLSFVYGAGAIFLIAWNASILGVVIGQDILNLYLSTYTASEFGIIGAYLHGLLNAFGYLPHGIFEIPAYFIGAIAGGIITIALTMKTKSREKILTMALTDALILILIAIILLLIGAAIEADALTTRVIETMLAFGI